MKKTTRRPRIQPAESMLQQKTNEDFNKKQPDPVDPNEVKGKPKPESTDNGYEDHLVDGSE